MSKHPTPDHYQRRVGGVLLDPYRIARVYGMTDDALFSALKKVLAAGARGAKDKARDVQEAIDALVRWQQMEAEDANPMVAATEARGDGLTDDTNAVQESMNRTTFGGGRGAGKTEMQWRMMLAAVEDDAPMTATEVVELQQRRVLPDPAARIAELERERDEVRLQVDKVRDGVIAVQREYNDLFDTTGKEIKLLKQECAEARTQTARWRTTAERAQSDLDALRTTLETEREDHVSRAVELERVRETVRWALGESGEFRLRGENEGAYWWRKELRQRAFPEPPAPEGE